MLLRRFAKLTVALAGCFSLLPGAQAAQNQMGWKVLKEQVTHRRYYDFLLPEGRCVMGWITKVDDAAVEVTVTTKGQEVKKTLPRGDILHVSDNWPGLVYSGRSSWADVLSASIDPRLRIRVRTKEGKTIEGTGAASSKSELTLKTAQGDVRTPKERVATVELVRGKPWSDRAEFAGQELGNLAFIEPETWPHLLHLSGTIIVPLYDASVVQDDTKAECATWGF